MIKFVIIQLYYDDMMIILYDDEDCGMDPFTHLYLLSGSVAGAARLPLHRGLCARRLLQPAEHPGAGPQGDARQPHQPDPVLHRGGGHPPHAGVHPLHRPHVHPRPAHQDQGGEGQ